MLHLYLQMCSLFSNASLHVWASRSERDLPLLKNAVPKQFLGVMNADHQSGSPLLIRWIPLGAPEGLSWSHLNLSQKFIMTTVNHKRKLVEILIIFFPYPLCEFIFYFLMPTYIYLHRRMKIEASNLCQNTKRCCYLFPLKKWVPMYLEIIFKRNNTIDSANNSTNLL